MNHGWDRKFTMLFFYRELGCWAGVTVFSPIVPPGGKAVVWGGCIKNNTKMAVSQPEMVRISFCKKGFEEKIVPYHITI